jgi:hypothetical protein
MRISIVAAFDIVYEADKIGGKYQEIDMHT